MEVLELDISHFLKTCSELYYPFDQPRGFDHIVHSPCNKTIQFVQDNRQSYSRYISDPSATPQSHNVRHRKYQSSPQPRSLLG